MLSHLQVPTHRTPASTPPTALRVLEDKSGEQQVVVLGPPPWGLADLQQDRGHADPQPLAPSSCGEPDAADSWRAGLPGTQLCPRRGWVRFNNFISPARTLGRLVLLSCLPPSPGAAQLDLADRIPPNRNSSGTSRWAPLLLPSLHSAAHWSSPGGGVHPKAPTSAPLVRRPPGRWSPWEMAPVAEMDPLTGQARTGEQAPQEGAQLLSQEKLWALPSPPPFILPHHCPAVTRLLVPALPPTAQTGGRGGCPRAGPRLLHPRTSLPGGAL